MPIGLREINGWDEFWQRLLCRVLLPIDTLVKFGIDPVNLTDINGLPAVRTIPGDQGRSFRLEIFSVLQARDALIELELADTSLNQIEVVWVASQDPAAPRFDVHLMPDGLPTMRGFLRRNLAAETAALAAGLAPGQTHRGLGVFRRLAGRLESFMACLNQREYVAEPLFYHTAVLFETVGFGYVRGRALMERIARGFAPGGDLRARLDGSTAFRGRQLANTVRGRSWAIHDGILDEPWDRVRMVKRLGIDAEAYTVSGVQW